MEGFTFYRSFFETLKKIRNRAARAQTALGILEFVFEDEEPSGLTEVGEIAFESFRHTLDKAKNNSGRGGRPKGERCPCEEKPNGNRIKTESTTERQTNSSLSSSSITDTPPHFSPEQARKRKDKNRKLIQTVDTGYNGMGFFDEITERLCGRREEK